MRTKNPGLMTQIQDFVNDFFLREYRMPSVQEIATATGIAKSSAHRYLVEMDKRGLLSYRAGEILTDMVNSLSFAIKNTPLTGGITCGMPVEENGFVELTDQDIKRIINDFARATEISLKAGYDGIEIHGANNFILQIKEKINGKAL